MKIPASVELAGLTVKTVIDNTLSTQRSIIGECIYSQQVILLDDKCVPKEQTEQAYIHELIHYILYVMNEEELKNNEKFVDMFAHLLYQSLIKSQR